MNPFGIAMINDSLDSEGAGKGGGRITTKHGDNLVRQRNAAQRRVARRASIRSWGSRLFRGRSSASQTPVSTTAQSVTQPVFGSSAKSAQTLSNQMHTRGWTAETVRHTINNPHATRDAFNRATGNNATAFFNKDGSHVIVDNITGEVVQVSNRFDTSWIPDSSIIIPFIP